MRPFDPDEQARLELDRDTMTLLWERFKSEHYNTANAPMHAPPMVNNAGYSLIEEILGLNCDNTNPATLQGMGNIAAVMFEFGQYCSRNDFNTYNMQQCICDSCHVDDEAIQRFIADSL